MADLKKTILIGAVDKFSGPARKIANISEVLASKLNDSQKELVALGKNNKSVERMRQLETRIGKTAAKMDLARKRVTELGKELGKTAKPTKKLQQEFDRAKRSVTDLKNKHVEQVSSLKDLRSELRGAGIDTRNLKKAQDGIAASLEKSTEKMKRMQAAASEIQTANSVHERTMQRAANLSLLASGLGSAGRPMLGTIRNPMAQMRGVERSRGELSSLGMQDTSGVIGMGRKLSGQLAGMNTAAFVSAAYDIKSGISSLTDQGVASMTALAAKTAKATKSDVGQMTSLFATGYGSFKNSLFKNLSDDEFGAVFSAGLSGAVKQFKTDGSKMQQSIQSMGSGLAESGIALADQFTALGMLQQKNEAGKSGTILAALERSAAKAQTRFADMGYAIDTLDANGNLRDLPDLLEEMQTKFGVGRKKAYSTEIGSIIQDAFGSEEAVNFFKSLWGQQDQFRENAKALRDAQKQGVAFTEAMARAMDNNLDSRLAIVAQKFTIIAEMIGYSLAPALERFIPAAEAAAAWISGIVSRHPALVTAAVGMTAAIGGIAIVVAPLLIGFAALSVAMSKLGLKSRITAAEMAAGGGARKGGWFGKTGKLGKFGKLSKMKMGGAAGLLLGAASIGSTLLDSSSSTGEKAASISADVGGIGGAIGGAALGAAAGSFIPVIGTAIGGIIGGIIGGFGGEAAGAWAGGMFLPGSDEALTSAPLVAGGGQVINSSPVVNLQLQASHDVDDVKAGMREGLREHEQELAALQRGAHYGD